MLTFQAFLRPRGMLYVVVGGLGWIFYGYLGCIGVVILIEFNFE